MQTHRLRRAEVVRMTEDRDPGNLAVHLAADVAPAPASLVAFHAIGFTFRGEKKCFVLSVPLPVAPEAQPAVVILRKLERTGRGADLSGDEVERPVTLRSTARVE